VLQCETQRGYEPANPLISAINLQVQAGQARRAQRPQRLRQDHFAAHDLWAACRRCMATFCWVSSVLLGMMAQDLSSLAPEQTPVECVSHAFPNQTEERRYLASYLLLGDEVLKPVKMLSYGQRARLELALLIVNGCNLLLLDEPVNHLDIPSRTQFELALDNFKGAVLAVVHDRYFIERFAEQVWMVEDGRIRIR